MKYGSKTGVEFIVYYIVDSNSTRYCPLDKHYRENVSKYKSSIRELNKELDMDMQ